MRLKKRGLELPLEAMVLRVSEFEDKDSMIEILKKNNYEFFVELVYNSDQIEMTYWKLTICSHDDLEPSLINNLFPIQPFEKGMKVN